jgi:hypothetical protein
MIPLARMGRRTLRFAPGAEAALSTPHASVSHAALVAGAERMLKFVRSHRKLLAGAFGPGFLEGLRETTRELKHLTTTESERKTRHAKSARALREQLARGHELVLILDGLILAPGDRDERIASTWKAATRLPKRLGRPKMKRAKSVPG